MPSVNRKPWLFFFFAIGVILFVWLNWFPPGADREQQSLIEANVGIDREEAGERAVEFARDRFGAGEWKSFVSYDQFVDALGYLTKEKLMKEYERYWSSVVPADFYRVQVKEMKTDVSWTLFIRTDNGTVFGWNRFDTEFDPADPAKRSDIEATLASMGYSMEHFRYDPTRLDDRFIYQHVQTIGQAMLTLHVRMSEGTIDSLEPIIESPEAFTDWKNNQDAKGAVTSVISLLLWFGLAIAAVVYMAVYRSTMSFSRGLWLSIAFALPYLVYNVNMYPGVKLSVPGSDGDALFGVMSTQFLIMLMAVSVYLGLVAGDGLWRRMGHEPWKHHRDRSFGKTVMRAVGLGYVYCFIILGMQSGMFFIAERLFDVWFGSDPLMSSHNLMWPALYPLLAWSAAISEEAVFRIFGIAFFTVLIRPVWRWAARLSGKPIFLHPLFYLIPAVTIANVLWALGHTSYSVYPVYTRLVEVTMLGFVFSYIFIRHGLIAAIFAHATMDLIIMSLELMSGGEQFVPLGLLYMLMPLAVGLLIRLIGRDRAPAPAYPPMLP